jgi:hypothetical protein
VGKLSAICPSNYPTPGQIYPGKFTQICENFPGKFAKITANLLEITPNYPTPGQICPSQKGKKPNVIFGLIRTHLKKSD